VLHSAFIIPVERPVAFDFKELEKLLACPASKSPLVQDGQALVCTSPGCRLQFAIRDDIPIMLVEEAKTLPLDEWEAILRKHGRNPAEGKSSS
jgi:uncharacterized protein YbaR (Trm112 family)